ncbi:MAG: hypothetical protein ACPG06_11830 [Alphaproteobacteria bacterium]
MKKALILCAALAVAPLAMTAPAVASDKDLLDAEACAKTKNGIGIFLGLADRALKDSEAKRKSGDIAGQEEAFKKVLALSELAENYTMVYQTFCD